MLEICPDLRCSSVNPQTYLAARRWKLQQDRWAKRKTPGWGELVVNSVDTGQRPNEQQNEPMTLWPASQNRHLHCRVSCDASQHRYSPSAQQDRYRVPDPTKWMLSKFWRLSDETSPNRRDIGHFEQQNDKRQIVRQVQVYFGLKSNYELVFRSKKCNQGSTQGQLFRTRSAAAWIISGFLISLLDRKRHWCDRFDQSRAPKEPKAEAVNQNLL